MCFDSNSKRVGFASAGRPAALVGWDEALRSPTRSPTAGAWWDFEDSSHPTKATVGGNSAGRTTVHGIEQTAAATSPTQPAMRAPPGGKRGNLREPCPQPGCESRRA